MTGATARRVGRVGPRLAARLESLVERSPALLVLGAVTVAATAVWGHQMTQVSSWFVQTDELQFVRLAMSIAAEPSLDPALRGQDIDAWSQLYPILLAPLHGLLDTPDAFTAAHWLNGFLMSSTAIPAYLLAREAGTSKLAGYAVAALSVCVPWLALGDMLRDDAAAYPAFVWALLAMQRALVEPAPRRETLAFGAILIASFARTQFVVLAPAFVLAVVLHEGRAAFVADPSRPSWADLVERLRARWVLIAVSALGVLYGLLRGFGGVFGSYESTAASGDLLPPGLPGNIAMHLSMVAVGIGVVPITFAAGWALASVAQPADRRRHAYAVLLLVVGLIFTVATSSFVLRNAGANAFDRYFFYLVPPALVGMAACVEEGRRRWLPAAAAALVFAWIAGRGAWAPSPGPYHQSPVSAFNSVLDFHAGRLGLSGAEVARWGGTVLALGAAMVLRFAPARLFLPLLAAGLLVFGAAETRSVFRSMASTQLGPPGDDVGPQYHASWIDEALPGDARVALLPDLPIEMPPGDRNVNNLATTTLWWDTEFWNQRVADVYVPENDQNADQSPFPKRVLQVDERSGRIEVLGLAASEQASYVVLDTQRADMRPEGRVVESTPWGLDLIDAERPYRTAWAAFGLAAGDAVSPGTPVRIRLFENAPARMTVSVVVPFQTTAEPIERRFSLSYGARTVRRTASSGETRSASVCLRRSGDTAVLRLAPSPNTDESIRLVSTLIKPLAQGRSCPATQR